MPLAEVDNITILIPSLLRGDFSVQVLPLNHIPAQGTYLQSIQQSLSQIRQTMSVRVARTCETCLSHLPGKLWKQQKLSEIPNASLPEIKQEGC